MDIFVEHITKNYVARETGSPAALDDVSLHIRSGELLALLGPSGSGKTTLLRVIAGLEFANRGRIRFGDLDATGIPVQKRGVGFVFQHYALFRHMNVFDNIAYGLRVRERATRPPEAEIRRRVEELLSLVQLATFEDRYPAQLSGGQRQRVALARALAIEPRMLLLDEPFGALDARVRKDLRRWLREIHDRTGQTTIFVTHDQEEALGIADRVAILKDGRIEQVGTPDEVHDDPASPFVMTFIGDTAALNVNIRNGAVLHAGKRLPIVGSSAGEGPGTLYVRPGHVQLAQTAGASLTGRVVSLRRFSSGQRAEVRLHGTGELVEAELPAGSHVNSGQDVGVNLGQVRIFR